MNHFYSHQLLSIKSSLSRAVLMLLLLAFPVFANGQQSVISGTQNVTVGTQYTYRSQSSCSLYSSLSYTWTISGGTVIAGGTSTEDYITVQWSGPGTVALVVRGREATGGTKDGPAVFSNCAQGSLNIAVAVPVAGTAEAPSIVCAGTAFSLHYNRSQMVNSVDWYRIVAGQGQYIGSSSNAGDGYSLRLPGIQQSAQYYAQPQTSSTQLPTSAVTVNVTGSVAGYATASNPEVCANAPFSILYSEFAGVDGVNWYQVINKSVTPLGYINGSSSFTYYNNNGITESADFLADPTVNCTTLPLLIEAEQATTNADVQASYVNNFITVGRFVSFNVNVPIEGLYTLDLRYSTAMGNTRTMSVYVNGVDVVQGIYPNTGSWAAWRLQKTTLLLRAGANTVKYQYDSDDSGYIDIDFLRIKPATYEAELASTNAPITPGEDGSGYVDFLTVPGRHVTYTVAAPIAGYYKIDTRYSAGIPNSVRTMSIYVNGVKWLQGAFPSTNDWLNWSTHSAIVKLTQGTNTIQYVYDAGDDGYINIDYTQVQPLAWTSITVPTAALLNAGVAFGSREVYAHSNSGTIQLTDYNGTLLAWQYQAAGTTTWLDLGSNTEEIPFENLQTTTSYRAKVGNCGFEKYSDVATIQVIDAATAEVDGNRNWVENIGYGSQRTVVGASRSYYDAMGRLKQTQNRVISRSSVLATEPLSDKYDQTVGSTLAAPTGSTAFAFKPLFVPQAADPSKPYGYLNFDGNATLNAPDAVGTTAANTLGWYYSANNTIEPLTAGTGIPYSRTYSGPDGSTGVTRSASPGEALRMGATHESVTGTFPVRAELDEYLRLRNVYFPSSTLGNTVASFASAAFQQVGRDPNTANQTVSSVVVKDKEGRPVMTARPGNWMTARNSVDLGWSYSIDKAAVAYWENPSFLADFPIVVYDGAGSLLFSGQASNFTIAPQNIGYRILSKEPFKIFTGGVAARTEHVAVQQGQVEYFNFYIQTVGSIAALAITPLLSPVAYRLRNTVTGVDVTDTYQNNLGALPSGFYQIEVTQGSFRLQYSNSYEDISYNFYNQKGELIGSLAPNGVNKLVQPTTTSTPGSASAILPANFSDGLVTWLRFDEQMGSIAADASGNGRNATLQGSTWSWKPNEGIKEGALELTGDNYLYVPVAWQPSAFTVSWWTKPYRRFAYNQMVAAGGGWGQFMFHTDWNGEVYVGTDAVNRIALGPNTLEVNTWQHFIFTFKSGVGQLYKNGQLIATKSGMAAPQAWQYFTFGTGPGGHPSEGLLDDCRVYSRALSDSDAKELYQTKLAFFTSYEYDNSGHLIALNEADAGRTEYIYRKDGQIRFSQNAKQRGTGAFSYTGYDRIGRAVEGGECHASTSFFSDIKTSSSSATYIEDMSYGGSGLPGYFTRTDIVRTTYDVVDPTPVYGEPVNTGHGLNGYAQEYLSGRVAMVAKYSSGSPYAGYNRLSQSWYSYDDQGRTKWLIQQVNNNPSRTTDYVYDYLGNVQSVCFQRDVPTERFSHYYTYDADQRLVKVETGLDNPTSPVLPHVEQARYEYYLHGPLKRIVYGRDLQGVDYTYTVQGWLKGINNAQTELDPSRDSPSTNGVLNDLFGSRLDYFNGDYTSRQLTAPSTSLPSNSARFDGTVRAALYHGPFTTTSVAANAFRYDAKGQLTESTYGQVFGGNFFSFNASRPNSEDNLTYEANGNLLSLRRRNGTGLATADYSYHYFANSNKLASVKDQNNQDVISYTYDRLGQLTAQQELDPLKTKYLDYDVSGKVTAVYRDAAKSQVVARYTYDEYGRRLIQEVFAVAPATTHTTTYFVRDLAGNELATYVSSSATGQTALYEQPIYGAERIGVYRRPRDQEAVQQLYELNDQLGNTRVVFRRPEVKTFELGMEGGVTERDEFPDPNAATYDNVRTGAYARTGSYAMGLLNQANLHVGPSKTITMERGDKLQMDVYAGYPSASGVILPRAAPVVIAGIAASLNNLRATVNTENPRPLPGWKQALSRLSFGLVIPLKHLIQGRTSGPLAVPQAGLQYVVRRADDNSFVRNGNAMIDGQAEGRWMKLRLDVEITETFPVKVEISMQNYDVSQTVYFDDLLVRHTTGPVVTENHFYPYGQRNEGLSWTRQYLRSYGRGYQGQNTRFDEETGYDNFELRLYDARVGRWMSTDPMGQHYSPYVGMGNDPVNRADPDGGWDWYGSKANPGAKPEWIAGSGPVEGYNHIGTTFDGAMDADGGQLRGTADGNYSYWIGDDVMVDGSKEFSALQASGYHAIGNGGAQITAGVFELMIPWGRLAKGALVGVQAYRAARIASSSSRVAEILMPGGEAIGSQMASNPLIRTVSPAKALSIVNRLMHCGAKLAPKQPSNAATTLFNLPGGGTFGVRTAVSSQSTKLGSVGAIDINIPGIAIKNIKF
jgi:RHS repeat-associated protein